jgi:hypothetical protein
MSALQKERKTTLKKKLKMQFDKRLKKLKSSKILKFLKISLRLNQMKAQKINLGKHHRSQNPLKLNAKKKLNK